MEKKLSHKSLANSSQRPASSLGMNKVSKTISKSSSSCNNSKPKIQIIHIFAPQIIKTDVENFRELVQRKTGKPPTSADAENLCKPTATFAASGTEQDYSRRNNNSNSLMISGLISHDDDDDKAKSKSKKMELMVRNKFTVKEEQVYISDEISSGGYLGGFSDLEEGLITELGGFSSMLPLD